MFHVILKIIFKVEITVLKELTLPEVQVIIVNLIAQFVIEVHVKCVQMENIY